LSGSGSSFVPSEGLAGGAAFVGDGGEGENAMFVELDFPVAVGGEAVEGVFGLDERFAEFVEGLGG